MIEITMTPIAAFAEINWDTLDYNAIHALYEACSRPADLRALLFRAGYPGLREDWQRLCVADFKALQGRDCPGCAT